MLNSVLRNRYVLLPAARLYVARFLEINTVYVPLDDLGCEAKRLGDSNRIGKGVVLIVEQKHVVLAPLAVGHKFIFCTGYLKTVHLIQKHNTP